MAANGMTTVSRLLSDWSAGDGEALGRLIPRLYDELRRLAARSLRREPPWQTLQTTELTHEAYLRLVAQRRTHWRNRGHFLAVAASLMRRVLVDRARRRGNLKRGGEVPRLPLDALPPERLADAAARRPPNLLALDEALGALAEIHPSLARLVEMRFFAGMSNEEIAAVLGISVPTVTRRVRAARAWLYRFLGQRAEV